MTVKIALDKESGEYSVTETKSPEWLDTRGLLMCAIDATYHKRNRHIPVEALTDFAMALDTDGIHVVTMRMPHEHVAGEYTGLHWRVRVMCKMEDTMSPREEWMDVSVHTWEAVKRDSGPPAKDLAIITRELNDGLYALFGGTDFDGNVMRMRFREKIENGHVEELPR